ncbi:UNVERIFIED_CONTAM: 1-acyl-sn-glycerol-3-phosphate acyltransferase [Acetivibrio alkalicellulosi]
MFEKTIKAFLFIIFSIFYRVEIIGKENVPQKGAALMCSNHVSEMDMLLFGYRINRLIRYMAKEELFKNPLFGAIIKNLGAFPIKRGTGDIGSIKTALRLLEDGHIVGIFPQGTRTKKKDVKEVKVKAGAALLAQKSGVPILPVAISGKTTPFSKIKIVFGKPFTLDLDKNKKYTSNELLTESENIMNRIYSLMEES